MSYPTYEQRSLYGWKTNPPYEYPQKTINTKYDRALDKCIDNCHQTYPLISQSDYIKNCQDNCNIVAIKASGFTEIKPMTLRNFLSQPEENLEGFMWMNRSAPSIKSFSPDPEFSCFYN